MVWYNEVRDGRFSWKRSPANNNMSTSFAMAKSKISLKVFIESVPLTASFSAYPMWLSVARRIFIQSLGLICWLSWGNLSSGLKGEESASISTRVRVSEIVSLLWRTTHPIQKKWEWEWKGGDRASSLSWEFYLFFSSLSTLPVEYVIATYSHLIESTTNPTISTTANSRGRYDYTFSFISRLGLLLLSFSWILRRELTNWSIIRRSRYIQTSRVWRVRWWSRFIKRSERCKSREGSNY